MKVLLALAIGCITLGMMSCNDSGNPSPSDDQSPKSVPSLGFSTVRTYPHDTSYFTEGLEFHDNTLLESTGLPNKSKLVQTEFGGTKVLKSIDLPPQLFGEGITVLHDTLYQLTYQEHIVNVYTVKDFKKVNEFQLNGEGYGLTNDGKYLIASNGSSDLFYYNPADFKLVKTLSVSEAGSTVPNINELEYVDGFIYANQWMYPYIVKIDLATGNVVGKMDLSNLVTESKRDNPQADYLNGIAYDAKTKTLHVTGKYWAKVYEIKVN